MAGKIFGSLHSEQQYIILTYIHTHTKYLLMNMYIHVYKRFIYTHIYEKGVYLHRSVDIHTHTTKADQCICSIIKTKMAQVRSFKTCK